MPPQRAADVPRLTEVQAVEGLVDQQQRLRSQQPMASTARLRWPFESVPRGL